MAQAQEPQLQGLTRADLQSILESVIKVAKEPSEADKLKAQKDHEALMGQYRQSADLAKTEEVAKSRRWNGCPHFDVYNGRKFHKWNGQVNSDGMVNPVCNICHVEAPPFSVNLLPDGGKQGVRFEEWNWPDDGKKLLIELHRKTFPKGCERATCFVCRKEEKPV